MALDTSEFGSVGVFKRVGHGVASLPSLGVPVEAVPRKMPGPAR
jgi:hypothetical protein